MKYNKKLQTYRQTAIYAAAPIPLLFLAVFFGAWGIDWYILLYCLAILQPLYYLRFGFEQQRESNRWYAVGLGVALTVLLCWYSPIFWLHYFLLTTSGLFVVYLQRPVVAQIRSQQRPFWMIGSVPFLRLVCCVEAFLLLLYMFSEYKTRF